MTPSDKLSLESLEESLCRSLGIPVRYRVPETGKQDGTAAPAYAELARTLSRLSREARGLRDEASRIGFVPLHYPRHVVIVMKAISALLPWYTRPISTFGSHCADTISEVTAALETVIREQEAISKQLAALKEGSRPAAEQATQER